MTALGTILIALLAAVAAGLLVVFLFIPLLKLTGRLVSHVVGTLWAIVTDVFRFFGALLVLPVFIALTVLSVVVGRWSAAGHYGRAVTGEIRSTGLCLYRVVIGHPLRLFGLTALVEGFEQRLPEVVAAAPGPDKPRGRKNQFEGYTIVGSLSGGGSGGRLYIAEPDDLKRAAFHKRGIGEIDRVVIKTFSVSEGSTLPQIIRESRALDAAKRLGLILEHSLTTERFYYAMRYIPGEPLSIVTQRAHADAGPEGLDTPRLKAMLGYGRDVLMTLERYHTGGLWHKDIKPDNVIVDGRGAHVVDLGLITPLKSAMTLTTHGTEYFRDPEMVRMALKGVKVSEINGEKFDLYAAAAVLYAMVENSFPAHGGLSQVTKRCPEAIRWIIRRGMAEYDKRYESVHTMLADLDTVLLADDPYAVLPAQLPSMSGEAGVPEPAANQVQEDLAADEQPTPASEPRVARAASPVPPQPGREPRRPSGPPKIRVKGWWSGAYAMDDEPGPADASQFREASPPAPAHIKPRVHRPASEQLRDARSRAAERRQRARRRMQSRRSARRHPSGPGVNAGVVVALAVVVGVVAVPVVFAFVAPMMRDAQPSVAVAPAPDPAPAPGMGIGQTPALLGMSAAASAGEHGSRASAVPALTHTPYRGRVLVVSGFRAPIDPRVERALAGTIDQLEQQGFETVGNIADEVSVDDLRLLVAIEQAYGPSPTLEDAAKAISASFAREAIGRYEAAVILTPDAGSDADRVVIADENSAYTLRSIEPATIARFTLEAAKD
ncbi:MAG: hypothetical protein AAGB48_12400 [Planctomycetota bacterium]